MSKSVGNALVAISDLNIPGFKHVGATVKFANTFDKVFDVMNSKTIKESFSKAPMSEKNENDWSKCFIETETYIKGLRHDNGQSVLRGRRSAGFIGWILNIESLRRLFEDLVRPGLMQFIITSKLNQGRIINDPIKALMVICLS